jgi:single-strand DNA-binding protein
MNSITLVGRAGRDPEIRFMESGNCVANLTLAVNGRSRDDDPLWFNLEIWGKQAQVAADYVRKGSLIGVSGSLKEEKWTDRTTGEERKKWVVNVQNLQLLGPKPDADNPADRQQQAFTRTGPARVTATAAAAGRLAIGVPPSEEEVPY